MKARNFKYTKTNDRGKGYEFGTVEVRRWLVWHEEPVYRILPSHRWYWLSSGEHVSIEPDIDCLWSSMMARTSLEKGA